MGPPSSGSNGDVWGPDNGAAGVDAGVTLSDIGLQAAARFSENIKAPPGVNLGAIGGLNKE